MFTVTSHLCDCSGFSSISTGRVVLLWVLVASLHKNQPKNNSEQKEVGKGSGRH